MITYLKDRLAEPSSKAVLSAFALACGSALATGVQIESAIYTACGAALVAFAGVLTPERKAE